MSDDELTTLQEALNALASDPVNKHRIIVLPSGSKLAVHEDHLPAHSPYVDRDRVVELDAAHRLLLDAVQVMMDQTRESTPDNAARYQAAHELVARLRAELELDGVADEEPEEEPM